MEDIITLGFLILLQAVLGFDNLLYISLESKRVAPERRSYVRRLVIGLAIGLRIVLLFVVVELVKALQNPLFGIHWQGWIEGEFDFHSLVVLLGGAFILYTATKEIMHMMHIEEAEEMGERPDRKASVGKVVTMIVVMNLVFSFDSILSAMALTETFWVMAVAIVITGILMIWLADHVSEFLQRNRMYEVLGLFILFIVGVMLVTEGGHKAHLTLVGNKVEAMTKTTFYFVLVVLLITEVVQSRYQRKLQAEKARRARGQTSRPS